MAREESTLRPGDNGASSEGVSGFSLEPSIAADTNAPSSSSGSTPHTDDSLISPTSTSHITLTDQDLSDLAARNDSISGFEATTGADLKSDAASGSQVEIIASFDARDGDSVSLPDITYIYDADYVRQGSDLLLIKPDGTAIQIENYFAVEITPDILGAGGRRLTPELVESFLHPVAPNQMAALTENQIAQAQGNSIGTVETITGDVYAVRPDGTRVLLQAGDPVFQGDQIETADGASIKMTFIDGTLFTLGGDARLALDEMVFNPATSSGESAFSILQGGFLFVSGQIAQNNPNDMTVTTPVATIGIRGTIVTGEVSGDLLSTGETFRFTVVDGEIAVTAGSQTIVLSENFATATGNADGTGGTNLFNFVDTAQNVIARNSSQFKALTPNDLRLIENAIKTTVESKTGQSIELDLQDLVTNTPDSQPNTQNEEEDGTNSEGGGDDEEGLTEGDLQGLEDSGDAGDEGGGDDGEAEPEDFGDVEVGDDTPPPDDETESGTINVTDPLDGSDTLGTTTGGDDNNDSSQTTGTGSTDSGEQTGTPIDTKPDPLQPPIIVPVPDPTPQPIVNPPPSPNPPGHPEYDYGYSNPNTSSAITIDYSSFAGSTDSYHVETGSGGDNVKTGGGGDFVSTGAGDDTIKTNGGNDTVIAGSGNDTIVGGSGEGNDFYNGGTGYDSVTYDSVSGQNETSLSVTLRSVSGTTSVNDSMAQIIGSDTLTNVDFIRLGHGDDTVTVEAAGIDVNGSEGRDTLNLSSIGGDVTFSFADGVFNKNSASSTFTNFEYVLGGEGNDKFTVDDISQSAGGGDGGSDTLVIGDDSLLLNLGGNVSSVFLTDGEITQTFTDFDSVEQDNSTLSLGNGTYSATGAVTLNTVTLDHYSAPVFAGSGTFVNSGEFRFQDSAGADLKTTLDSRDGTFNLTGSLSQLDINDGGRLIIGSDTDYIANTLSALSINVNSNGTVEIASGETASLADANFRFAENSSYLTVNGTWLNSGSDVFSGFNVGTASSEINGTGIIKNGGEITFNNDSINVDIQNTIPLEESDGTIIVTGSGRSLEVNSTITGGTVVVEDSSGMGGTGSLVDLAALKLFDGSSISVSSAEVVGTITLNGSSEILGSLNLTDAALAKDPQASSGDLNIKDGGVVLIGTDTSLDDFSNGRFLLNNGGEVRIGSGESFDLGDFYENNASITEQQSGGTINILGNATIGAYKNFSGLGNNTLSTTINGSGNFSSSGSLSLSGDTVNIQFANLNTGTLQINSGTTTFNADITSSGTIDIEGTFATNEALTNTGDIDIYQDGDLTGNGRVTNNGGHVTLHSGASMSVASFDNFGGMLDFSYGDATISGGTLDITGGELYADENSDSLTVENATAIVGANTSLGLKGTTYFSQNGTLSVTAGETFTNNADTTAASFKFLAGSTISGDGVYRNLGTLQLSGVTIADNASIENDGIFNVGTLGLTLGGGQFDNSEGTIAVNSNSTMTLASGGTIALDGAIDMNGGGEIAGAGTLDVLQLDGSLSSNAAGGTNVISVDLVVSHSGSIVIGGDSGSDGTLLITGAFQNDGFVQVDPANQNENGVLKISQNFTNFGTLQVDNAATLVVGDGLGTMTNEGTLQGQSSLLFENGIIQAGRIINDGVLLVPGFTEVGSRLEIQGTRFDSLDGTITINNGGVLSFLSSTLTVGSDTEYNNSGSLVIGSSSVLDLGANFQFENTNASTIILSDGSSVGGVGTLLNYGTMDLDGVTIDATFENATTEGGVGAVNVVSGAVLTVNGSLTNANDANFTVASGGTLAGSGSITNNAVLDPAGITIENGLTYTGDIQFTNSADSLTVNGTLNSDLLVDLGQTGAVIGGFGTLNLGDATLTGTGDVLETSLRVQQSGTITFDSADSTINVSSGRWVLESGAGFANSNGTLALQDGVRLQLASGADFSYDSTSMADLRLGVSGGENEGSSEIYGNATFTVADGTLTIDDQEVYISTDGFIVNGDFDVNYTNVTVTSSTFQTTASGSISVGAGSLTVENGMTNAGTLSLKGDYNSAVLALDGNLNNSGTIYLDSGNGTQGSTITAEGTLSSATLVNTGVIEADLPGTASALHLLQVNIDNTGTINILRNTRFGETEASELPTLLTADGTVSIASGRDFEVLGTMIVGADTNLNGSGTLVLGDQSSFQVVSGENFTIGNSGGTLSSANISFEGQAFINGPGVLVVDQSVTFQTLEVSNGASLVNSDDMTGTDFVIDTEGEVTNAGTLSLNGGTLSIAGSLNNDGQITIDNGRALLNSSEFDNTGGTLRLKSDEFGGSTLTVNAAVTNAGHITISMDGGQSPGQNVVLNSDNNSTLTNSGTFEKSVSPFGNSGTLVIGADIVNTGTMSLEGLAEVQSGTNLDTRDGIIHVTDMDNGPNGVLNFLSNSTLIVGDASVLTIDTSTGTNRGTIDFAPNAVLSVAAGETFTVDDDTVELDFTSGGLIAGTGTYKVAQDTQINMNGATFTTAALLNEGTIEVESTHGLRLNNSAVNNSQGLLDISARAAGVELDIGTDMTLGGDIRLSMNSNGTIATQATLAVDSGSTLTLTGTLQSAKESGAGISNHTSGTIINQGMVDIDQTLTIADNFDTRDGQIDIASSQALNVAGTLTIGNDTALSGAGSISIGSTSLLDIASGETFTLTTLTPDLDFASGSTFGGAGTLRVNSDVSFDMAGFTLAPGSITNNGTITVDSASGTLGAGAISGSGSLAVIANSDFSATLVLSDDVTNASGHTIALEASDGTFAQGVTLTSVNGETLTNNGILHLENAADAHELDLNIRNSGLIDVDGSATLTSGHHLNSVGGAISIATGETLFADGTLTLGSGSTVSAAGAEIAGVGTLAISGGAVNLTNATLSTSNIDNDGTILVNNGGLTLASSNFDNAGGTIDFYSANANSTIWFNTDFNNAGTIKVRANSESMFNGGLGNTLTNSGLIAFSDGDKAGTNDGGGENRIKTISVVNTGTITQGVNDYLRIYQGASVNSVNGALLLASGAVFDVNGGSTLFLGTNTNLTGTGTIELQDYATLSLGSGENFSYDSTDATIVATYATEISGAGTFTNQRSLDATDWTISSNFVNGENGILNIGALLGTTDTTLSTQSFVNNGELNVIGANGVESTTRIQSEDIANTGTINLTAGTLGSSVQMTLGDQGDGTLTNDGLISVTGTDANYFGGAVINGNVEAGTTGGEIFIGSYTAIGVSQFNPLHISGDLTLNQKSLLTMEMGAGNGVLGNHSAGLQVDGTLTYGGTFELRVGDSYDYLGDLQASSGPQITAGSESGFFQRVHITNEAGTGDADLATIGKVLIPNFTGTEFKLEAVSSLGGFTGGSGDENVNGTAGNDIFTSGDSGTSVWFGQGGNDTFTLESGASIGFLDGGQGGADILYLQTADSFAATSDNEWRVNNIEALDFSGAASGTMALSESFAFGASEDSNSLLSALGVASNLKEDALIIEGNVGQTLDLSSGNWTAEGITVSVDHDGIGGPSSYAIYSASNGAHAYVDTEMAVDLVGTPA